MQIVMRRRLTILLLGCVLAASAFLFHSATSVTSDSRSFSNWTQYAGNPNVRVWVNTNSGIYHCPGTRWYGATKEGEYMTQREAQKKGYRPAYYKPCE
jgi:hypothetical protein